MLWDESFTRKSRIPTCGSMRKCPPPLPSACGSTSMRWRKPCRAWSRNIDQRAARRCPARSDSSVAGKKRGGHGCFFLMDHSILLVLAHRNTCSGAVPHRVVADAAFSPCRNRRQWSFRAPQRYVYASYSVTARPASHLSGALRYRCGYREVNSRKTSVFTDLRLFLGGFASRFCLPLSVENVVESVAGPQKAANEFRRAGYAA